MRRMSLYIDIAVCLGDRAECGGRRERERGTIERGGEARGNWSDRTRDATWRAFLKSQRFAFVCPTDGHGHVQSAPPHDHARGPFTSPKISPSHCKLHRRETPWTLRPHPIPLSRIIQDSSGLELRTS